MCDSREKSSRRLLDVGPSVFAMSVVSQNQSCSDFCRFIGYILYLFPVCELCMKLCNLHTLEAPWYEYFLFKPVSRYSKGFGVYWAVYILLLCSQVENVVLHPSGYLFHKLVEYPLWVVRVTSNWRDVDRLAIVEVAFRHIHMEDCIIAHVSQVIPQIRVVHIKQWLAAGFWNCFNTSGNFFILQGTCSLRQLCFIKQRNLSLHIGENIILPDQVCRKERVFYFLQLCCVQDCSWSLRLTTL